MSEQFPYSFGKYRMEAEIGRGGFGTVFRAVDVDLDRPVAIKIMDPIYMRDQRWVARFRREARLMAQLDHLHIVPIYEISEEQGRLYLAMKLIDGTDLTELIAKRGALPWEIALELVGHIASALDYAHQRKVIHRDLKPGNILVSNGSAMLTDFGLAQMMESNSQSVSVSGGFAGTYNYMPPEVFNNEGVTPASDVYALGCVIYEMLVGNMLVDGQTTAAIIGAHLKGITIDEPLPEGTPPGTREILQIALAKDPLKRYASAGELASELQLISIDRLTAPYAKLEQAVSKQHWAEALALAAEVRAQESNYRDVAALEEQAQRGHWSEQWQTEAQQALDSDDFDAVRGALTQWRKVDPDSSRIQRYEKELDLAVQYVTLEQLIASGDWQAAQPAVETIYVQNPSFRNIAALHARINVEIESSPQEGVFDASEAKMASTTAAAASKTKFSAPTWAWWIGAIGVMFIIAFIIYAMSRSGGGELPVPTTAAAVELPIEDGADEPVKEASSEGEQVVVTRVVTVVREVEEPTRVDDQVVVTRVVTEVREVVVTPTIEDVDNGESVSSPTKAPKSAADVTANFLSSAPVIDGTLADWPDNIPSYKSAFLVYQDDSWDGSDDIEAIWQLGWDFSNLYLAVTVLDDAHVQTKSDIEIYLGDSVEIQFDTDLEGDFGTTINADDLQLNASPGDFQGVPAIHHFWRISPGGRYQWIGNNDIVLGAQDQDERGYVLELAIPWAELGVIPTPGHRIGIALNVSDNDGPGTAVQEVMKSNSEDRNFTYPETWGTLTLQE